MSTAVILAGGKSSRMGQDKLALKLGTETLLSAAVRRFSGRFQNVYVSVSDPEKYPEIQAEKIRDLFLNCGPLGGLHAALTRAEDAGVFLVAADLPFSSPEAALKILELCGSCEAALLCDAQGRPEPLFAFYKKPLREQAEKLLKAGIYKMSAFLEGAKTRIVTKEELGPLWTDRLLINVNHMEDYLSLPGL